MKLLVAGVDPQSLDMARPALDAAGHRVEICNGAAEVCAALTRLVPPEGILLGSHLDRDRSEVVMELRELLNGRPAWLATWSQVDHDAWAALAAGADDVLIGEVDGTLLALRLSVGERVIARQRSLLRLRYLARHPVLRDPLTGTLRQSVLLLQLEQAIARSRRTEESVALLALEVERPGGLAEADLSAQVLARVRPALRPGDSLALAEERTVLILLEGCTLPEACVLAEDLHGRVLKGAAPGSLGCTIGIAAYAPGEPVPTAQSLLDRAGNALARAQLGGGNRVLAADQEEARQAS